MEVDKARQVGDKCTLVDEQHNGAICCRRFALVACRQGTVERYFGSWYLGRPIGSSGGRQIEGLHQPDCINGADGHA